MNRLPFQVPGANVDGPFIDPSNPPLPIQQSILRNLHQCLIAEIAFDPVPIPPGKDPSNWDKLAQRNLAWSDAGSATAVSTFEIRPTPWGLQTGETPDELMIDWGNTPRGQVASIYLPAADADEILATAGRLYTFHGLTKADDHTVQCRTTGVTYMPIPTGGIADYAGLLSVQLPSLLRQEQIFNIVVRQVTNSHSKGSPPRLIESGAGQKEGVGSAVASRTRNWRRVLGAFQLSIPVNLKEILLPREERDLSVLLSIGQAIPNHSRWSPVFRRYLETIAGRVKEFGGDPMKILPSPTGDCGKPGHGGKPGDDDGHGSLEISVVDNGGGIVNDVADVFLKHQQLSDERQIRRWKTDQTLVVRDLISTNTGIYALQVLPDHHEAVGRFVTIEEGEEIRVKLVLEKEEKKKK